MEDSQMPHLPPAPQVRKMLLLGEQQVAKHRDSQEAANVVTIMLALARLGEPHNTDVLITLNAPSQISNQSSSATLGCKPMGGDIEKCNDIFTRVVASFNIVDYTLFGSG
eukprot:TRINITY_DN67459_c3_g4_i1.p2 TRINITY_DN67459_c3_g4~~TRINITY_DN67459_c3_g4_i1.p2  ORF type:complete len:110 (+),score=12.01 TRINITY_DN67459_c3_g4_i1:291-620(+)